MSTSSSTPSSPPVIHKSPWGEVPDLFVGNIAQFVRESPHINRKLDKKILIDAKTNQAIRGRQLFNFTARLSWVLRTKYKIEYDDVVCLFAPNSVWTPIIHHGVLSRGAILSPANIAYNPEELHYQIKTANAKLALVGDAHLETARKALKVGPNNCVKIVPISRLIKDIKFAKGVENPVPLEGDVAKDKIAYLCFSSGTSGTPKGVMTTHYNMTSNAQQQFYCFNKALLNGNNVYGAVLPMSHIFGLTKFVYSTLYVASTIVVFEKFDFPLLLSSILKYNINVLHVVPPILVLFAKSPLVDKYAIKGRLNHIFTGAAPAGKEIIALAEARTGAHISQGYGLTESSPVTHLYSYDEQAYDQNSIGWLIASCEARLVTDEGTDAAVGERGELWIRGPNIMKGYLNNPAATAETLTSDGFLKTGDVAIRVADGQYYIVDRKKELIKSKGHQVAPAELEALLLDHPDVVDVAVVGVHVSELGTELPRAFLVIREKTDPLEIKKWFDSKVARHKRLWGGIVVLDAIPKSPSGKILRRLLRDRKDDKAIGFTLAEPKL
ncbi:Pcs60p [Sugiyamaella lignohabitans]|uniref:Pcs60p n=1 Tax=Sugiyamaella lignohabitans TaxID=796027 RepID=A0A161HGU3_9ASCO|nr:Pcs60p [Sugiyamaella lignohabitans]ANB11107.1 Pcs60p [Sugiyamaella lignohabitans]